jgi:hypothetical protein
MIATAFKSKIPQTHSYAVGAELLSKSLSSVPQYESLKLNFYGLWAASEEKKTQPLLNVNHINIRETQYSSKDLVAQGFYDDTWEIVVYPVLRTQKAKVRNLLLTEGLPKVKEWLSANRSSTWLEGRRTLSIFLDVSSGSLRYREENGL